MFVRFAVADVAESSQQQLGVFTALYRLEREGRLGADEEVWFAEAETWFNEHLRAPDRLTLSKRPGAPRVAITWLKASAVEHVRRMRELVALLRHKDIHVDEFTSDRPGYVVYEDDHQVAAVPFAKETFRRSPAV
jgi:hypothetical protein